MKLHRCSYQDSLDQCPMLINADQNSGIEANADQFLSIQINANDRH